MKCVKCGARIRPGDRFCPACGSALESSPGDAYPGEKLKNEGSGKRRNKKEKKEDSLIDERLYRDSFLEERGEERSRALLSTLVILLVIVLVAAAVLALVFYFRPRSGKEPGPGASGTAVTGETGDVITILDWDGSRPPQDASADAGQSGGDGANGAQGTDSAGNGAGNDQGTDGAVNAQGADGTSGGANGSQSTEGTAQKDEGGETEKMTEAAGAAWQVTPEAETRLSAEEVDRIIADISGADQYGLYVYDLKENRAFIGGSGQTPMFASAAITVPILYTAASLLDAGECTMDTPLVYVNSIGGRGEPNPETRDGSTYPLSYYLTTMLRYSDNNCMNCLIDFLGPDTINAVCAGDGYTSVDLQRKIVDEVTDGTENYVSAADLGGMTRDLWLGRFTSVGRAFMEEYFRIGTGTAGETVIGLSPQIASAGLFLNQDGLGETRFAEVAVVSDGDGAFIISEMMTGPAGFDYTDAGMEIAGYVKESLSGGAGEENRN